MPHRDYLMHSPLHGSFPHPSYFVQLSEISAALPGLVQPGLMQPVLLHPGLVQPGLLQPGLLLPGLVFPGLVQPWQFLHGLIPPNQTSSPSRPRG